MIFDAYLYFYVHVLYMCVNSYRKVLSESRFAVNLYWFDDQLNWTKKSSNIIVSHHFPVSSALPP